MGSGSSKEKSPKKSSTQSKVDQNSKDKNLTNRNRKVSSIGVNDTNDIGYSNKNSNSQPVNNNVKEISNSKQTSQNLNGGASRTIGGSGVNKNVTNFESDSESETEDINEVLEATRREHEERVKEQNYYNARHSQETDYPETYAQRQQRTQYKPELGIIRQKTIYRNPDEWQMEDEERGNEDGFDVNKFKQANAAKQVQHVHQDRDIFSPSEIVKPSTRTQYNTDADDYYKPTLQKQKSLPKYDMSEEALLAEIEKEYDF